MSKRLDVIAAVIALVTSALPGATVTGIDGTEKRTTRTPNGGRAVIHAGDPGEPEIDLSPIAYNYAHRIPIVLTAPDEATLDAMLGALGNAIAANRTLGGLCSWIDATAPETEEIHADGAPSPRGTELILVAEYATANPLS